MYDTQALHAVLGSTTSSDPAPLFLVVHSNLFNGKRLLQVVFGSTTTGATGLQHLVLDSTVFNGTGSLYVVLPSTTYIATSYCSYAIRDGYPVSLFMK